MWADRLNAYEKAIDQIKTDRAEHAVYVEVDVANLGGLNRALGREGADNVLRMATKTVQEELGRKIGGSATLVRHGGDEFSAILVGPKATKENVTAALESAQRKMEPYSKQHGLDTVPHAKHPDDVTRNGTSLHFGVAQVTPRDTPASIFDAADHVILLGKSTGGH